MLYILKRNNKLNKIIVIVSVLTIAMAFLESSVVIYLRALMYPEGFSFPLAPIPAKLALTEILREAATLIMLLTIGMLAGKRKTEKFAWFIYAFGVWDIFYYVFLKLLLDWPDSFLTWDILFLIPATWTGPVIAPIIVSLSMIFLALVILILTSKRLKVTIKAYEWLGLIVGSVILVFGFIYDYSKYILHHFSLKEIFIIPQKQSLYDTALQYVPQNFPWIIFLLGQGIIIYVIINLWFRYKPFLKL